MQVWLSFSKALLVWTVNDINHGVDFVEIVLPKSGRLTTDIPQGKLVVPVLDGFYVKSNCRHSFFELLVAHLEQQRRLASIVNAKKEYLFLRWGFIAA